MKKAVCLILAAALIICASVGCSQKKAENVFEADNEIMTYRKIDPEKTQLIISRTGNIPVEQLCLAFEAANPDIQIIFLDITGGNSAYNPLTEYAESENLPDVVITSANYFDAQASEKYFENLSDNPIVQNYEAAALQRTATDSFVYWLPGPSDISAIMYNKTLFERCGWKVPADFDEFVALCDQINEDTEGAVEPWNPNAKYGNELITALEAITYEELFGGLDNRSWYDSFTDGSGATFAGHMEPYCEVIQTLIDHNILREEHFSYSATTRGKEFIAGNIAMINANIYLPESEEFEFGFMPFPPTKGEIGYLCDKYSCFVGLPKKEHSEKENEAIDRFLRYFSSAEGQKAYIGNSLKVSNVKNVPFTQSDELSALKPALDAGHMFGLMEFRNKDGGYSTANMHEIAVKMVTEGKSGAECIAEVDKRRGEIPETGSETETPEVLAAVPENMTVLETSFYIADMYREKTGADIGLITNSEAYRGNLMRFFAGDVTQDMIEVFKPRSFGNGSKLIKVSMSGKQLTEALNNPVGYYGTADCIYAYSGLNCEVAPWNELGTKYLSVKLADGSELEDDKLYTVAVWEGTIAEEYITQIIETYEGSWEELMTEKLKADKTVAPKDDGRIRLVWE